MRLWHRFRGGVAALLRRARTETDLEEELRQFREVSIEAKLAAGMSPEAAARAARLEVGSPPAVRDWVRDVGWEARVESVWQDVRYAIRMLRRSPGFACAAITTFALGIGANTAIFSIVDAAILRPLPYDEPDRIVTIRLRDPNGRTSDGVMARDFLDWRERHDLFEAITLDASAGFTLLGAGEPQQVRANRTTAGFFEVFRVAAHRGRFFGREHEVPGHDRVVVISHAFWRTRFGASADAVGRTIQLNGEPYEIIGVLPDTFTYPPDAAVNTPLILPNTFAPADHLRGVTRSQAGVVTARLAQGVNTGDVEAALGGMLIAADGQKRGANKGFTEAAVSPMVETYVGPARSWMAMLLAAVALVLLIACANVANLVLAHNAARSRELTLRVALGAGRWRIARQLTAECTVLALLGGLAGVLIGWWGIAALRGAIPASVPRGFLVSLDTRVLLFTAAVAMGTGPICGLLPAIRGSRVDLAAGVRTGGGSRGSSGPASQRPRDVLVWAEVALATMLLIGAGLFVSSFARLLRVDHGFDPRGVVAIYMGAVTGAGGKPAHEMLPRLLEAVRAVPGVEAALITGKGAPYEGGSSSFPLRIRGRAVVDGQDMRYRPVSAGFLEMLRVPLRRGRLLQPDDTRGRPPVAVINEAAVRQYWPGRDPLGDRFEIGNVLYEIVGVVGDMRYTGPASTPLPEAFVPYEHIGNAGGTFLVRSGGDPRSVIPAVKAALWSVKPDQPVTDVRTADELFDRVTASRRFNMLLMSIFATLALVIAATGIYGVVAFIVGHRTREIGVRLALGATPAEIVRLFVRQGAVIVLLGILTGLAGGWWLARAVQGFLFEVRPHDPVVFVSVACSLAAVGLFACWIPARRAARVDPLVALQAE